MLFKNLCLFRLAKPLALNAQELHAALEQQPFRPCGSLQLESLGWVAPLGRSATELAHSVGDAIFVSLRKESRLLPAAVVNELLAERVEDIAEQEGRRVGRQERAQMKEQLVHELLPRAFTRSKDVSACILAQSGWVIINTTSTVLAETLLSRLREVIGTLPVAPPRTRQHPAAVMTAWLNGADVPAGLTLGDECELRETGDDPGLVRAKRLDLRGPEIQAHLAADRQVVKLALEYAERLSFVLDETLGVKRLVFDSVVLESLDDLDRSDTLAVKDAEMALLALELEAFLPVLLEWFGGEADEGVG